MAKLTYRDAGVDIDAADDLVKRIRPAIQATMRPEVLAGVGGFASLVAVPSAYRDPVLVSGTDGVGTKLKIAFATGEHRTVGIDLVAMCVNDVLATGARPLFFLDYYACGQLAPQTAAEVIEGIAAGCREAGCALVGGETAELPGFYQPGEYDLAGFSVGVVERDKIVNGQRAGVGDAVIGLPSSGLHSNGFSLARAVVERTGAALDDKPAGLADTLGAVLLCPTRIYAREISALLDELDVRALAHITGGGLLENIPRTLPEGLGVRLSGQWPIPPIFEWIAAHGPVEPREMLRTFNMGIGMTAVLPQDQAEQAVQILRRQACEALVIGEVVPVAADKGRVVVEGTA